MWAPTARYRAAELYADLGRYKEAIAIYKDMAVSTKGTVQGEFAKQRLMELQDELAESQPATKKPAAEKPALKKGTAKPSDTKTPPRKNRPPRRNRHRRPRARQSPRPRISHERQMPN